MLDLLHVNLRDDVTLVQQLRQQITWLILNEAIKTGEQLPSIHAVADYLGINLQTVRAAYKKLEADGLVETRQGRGTHVLDFNPHHFIQAATYSRSHTIGVLIPSWANPFYHAFLQGVEEIAEEDQTMIFLCNTHDNPKILWRNFARLSAKRVDGILVASYDISEALDAGGERGESTSVLPYVTVDYPASSGYSVEIDLELVGYQATKHLLEHGHRRIGLMTTSMGAENVLPINRGYQRALTESGAQVFPEYMIQVPGFLMKYGEEGARRFLEMKERPTAIFAIADTLALGAMKTIKQSGLTIPADVALVSFNDIPGASLVDPPLTTVSTPAVQMGREAMKMLQALIDGKKPTKRHITLPVSLIIRQSCGEHEPGTDTG